MELSQRRARLVARLVGGRKRSKERLVLVEGIRAVREALDAGATVSFAVVAPRLEHGEGGLALLLRLSETSSLDVVSVSDEVFAELAATERPQGVLLVCEEPRWGVPDVARREARLLVLDAIQDPGNVGTLVRSAVAFGFDAVVALDGTADPWGAKAVRASAGTAFRIALVRASGEDILTALAKEAVPILVASAEGERIRPTAPGFALVLGNEGAGVREEVRASASAVVSVAMTGGVESLNVGIAGSILMHELTRDE